VRVLISVFTFGYVVIDVTVVARVMSQRWLHDVSTDIFRNFKLFYKYVMRGIRKKTLEDGTLYFSHYTSFGVSVPSGIGIFNYYTLY
jgi:hypothetical protein